jgi:cephalosporin hydroxylase
VIKIDPDAWTLTIERDGGSQTFPLGSREAFETIADLYIRSGWDAKYLYTFTWFGRPIIQLPDDMLRVQEVLYKQRPDVVIETGVAHGGSLVFYASIFEAMKRGRVIGVDIEIRPHNRKAIEEHEFSGRIELVEGDSTDPGVVGRVRNLITPGETVLVFLDSNHSKDHVLRELEAYSAFVSPGSYIVSTDGIMKDVLGSKRAAGDWDWNNPYEAARTFLAAHPEFVEEEPPWPFDESNGLRKNVTQWPGAWLRRVK